MPTTTRPAITRPGHAPRPGTDEGLIRLQVTAAGAACARMTSARLKALRDSVQHAACLRGGSPWYQRAAAHAEFFTLLAGMTDDPALAPMLSQATDVVRQLVLVVGPAADGMIINSHYRLLAHLRVRDADGAALEMERHLRTLVFLWRLALPGREAAVT
jgi:GntR family transcriptional regulator, transcriptional repressor for pyruvate dehydrogenase complex